MTEKKQSLQSLTPLVFYIFIKMPHYRDKQLIWLKGNLEKATFSR